MKRIIVRSTVKPTGSKSLQVRTTVSNGNKTVTRTKTIRPR